MVTLCRDVDALGAPFYVMSLIDGTVYRSRSARGSGAGRGVVLANELLDVLGRLHDVDPAQVGRADRGRPDGYLERQVRRWGKQLDASRTRDVPGLADLGRRLAAEVPRTRRSSLVHGDYKLDNVVVDAGGPGRVLAVLDWEMATLGDPSWTS